MALVRALNSSIGGLRAQQFKIDTIGDNLANSTTTAFKAGRVEFKTLLSQTVSFGTAPQGFLGTEYALALFLQAFGVALLLGFVGAFYPAVQAGRLSPIEALKYE